MGGAVDVEGVEVASADLGASFGAVEKNGSLRHRQQGRSKAYIQFPLPTSTSSTSDETRLLSSLSLELECHPRPLFCSPYK